MRSDEFISENLKQWFKDKWVRFGPDGKIRGDCARGSSSEGKPKCLPQSKAQALGKKGRASSAAKKRREDPNPERRGAAKNVATKVKEQDMAEGHADQQRRVFKKNGEPVGEVGIDREPSPGVGQYYMKHYASGKDLAGYDSYEEAVAELKHCMKQGISEADLDEACWKGYHKDGMKTMFGKRYPNCVKNEDASDAADSGPNILELLRSWRNRVPAQYAWHLTKTFGDPHDTTDDLVVWHDRDGFKRIEIKDEYVMHISPSPHYDYCYSYIDLQVPHRLSSALANCSESILIDHLKNEVGARCASLAANAVTLNFVMDVVAGRTRPSRDEYEKRIMDMHDDFENGKIFTIQWWPDQSYDTDPANPYYRKQQKSKTQDKVMQEQQCPECGGPMYPETMINEKQDACYHKVKSRYKVWPSAYASGALVQCRKKGAANWGNKSKNESVENNMDELSRILELGTGLSLEARAELHEEFDLIETIIEGLALHNGVDADVIWEDLESLTDDELYVFATTTPVMEDWQKANKKDRTAGMSQKAVNAYRRENPGSKLKTAVTTKPSKLKKGSKASKRRKSYCSRSKGQMNMHNISCAKTPDKAICKARRRWNC